MLGIQLLGYGLNRSTPPFAEIFADCRPNQKKSKTKMEHNEIADL